MAEKLRFKPMITRIKLNPEQAVLACGCFSRGLTSAAGVARNGTNTCRAKGLVNRIHNSSASNS